MRNIYLAQFSLITGNYAYFPYSVGSIWAYAQTHETITGTYNLSDILYLKQPITEIVNSLDNPYLVGFSVYIWNTNYCIELARAIKITFPSCIIVFGGPNVPKKVEPWLRDNTFIDYAIIDEGEQSFASLLLYLIDNNTQLTGIAYLKDDIIKHEPARRITDLQDIPSPYILGLFDNVIADAKTRGLLLNAVFETNRGCPFRCTFCDWGGLTQNKINKLELNRVLAEITWFADNKIELINSADANFGILAERDQIIVDHICAENTRTGWPKIADWSWTKNLSVKQLDMAETLYKQGIFRRFTSSMQTLNDDVLKTIKRANLSKTAFEDLIAQAKSRGIPASTELIIGLPEESARSYKLGVSTLIEKSIAYYTAPLTLLQNSEMAEQAYTSKYGIKTKKLTSSFSEYVEEHEYLVVETNAMSKQDYTDLMIWNFLVNCVYGYRTYNHIINKLAKIHPLVDVLDTIVNHLRKNSPISELINNYSNHVDDNLSYILSNNGVSDLDTTILSLLCAVDIEAEYLWWNTIYEVSIDDIVHQRLSINRSYEAFNKNYNGVSYSSKGIPDRYPNWQTWLITTRWNTNAERQVKEIT
jgi:radical SAM superfamily enzyme YgiQ (UPF0313 family)